MVFFATIIGDFASQLVCGYPADNPLMCRQHKHSTDSAQTFCGPSMNVLRLAPRQFTGIHNRIPYLILFLFLIIEGIILAISVNTKRGNTSAKFRMESANCPSRHMQTAPWLFVHHPRGRLRKNLSFLCHVPYQGFQRIVSTLKWGLQISWHAKQIIINSHVCISLEVIMHSAFDSVCLQSQVNITTMKHLGVVLQ